VNHEVCSRGAVKLWSLFKRYQVTNNGRYDAYLVFHLLAVAAEQHLHRMRCTLIMKPSSCASIKLVSDMGSAYVNYARAYLLSLSLDLHVNWEACSMIR
jgi:hypothetical protein